MIDFNTNIAIASFQGKRLSDFKKKPRLIQQVSNIYFSIWEEICCINNVQQLRSLLNLC